MDNTFHNSACHRLLHLTNNSYPGRGFILGVIPKYLVQIYWVEGRSEPSRNRILEHKDGIVKTDFADPSKVDKDEDTSLLIYDAMIEDGNIFAVSNGRQTIDVIRCQDLASAMDRWKYEPDKPSTPRITGVWTFKNHGPLAQISFLRRSPFGPFCESHLYTYPKIEEGYGYCIHTYDQNGDPLPPFSSMPYILPLEGTPDEILKTYWDVLDRDNRVAIAMKIIGIDSHASRVLKPIGKYIRE